jgi:RNA-directed DNA polymerase
MERNKIRYVVEADIEGYFDNVNHEWLRKFLRHRIADNRLLQIIGKWLKAGFMDNGVVVRDEKGTPQGGPISPLLANIYLHYVLDLWFEMKFKRSCKGRTFLVRYADDFVTCFEHREEAERFLREMEERLSEFGLKLSREKTRIIEIGKRSSLNGTKGPGEPRTFDFLGFTHFMKKSRKGDWYYVATKPSRKSRNKFLQKVKEWCVENRHCQAMFQAMHLKRMLNGLYNYFNRNVSCHLTLIHLKFNVVRIFMKALMRRSQRTKLAWKRIQIYNWYSILPNPKRVSFADAISGSRMP